ncbi:MAG: conjugal transfer protein TraG N-terminal domain-containing protein, partial [Candidatus Zixiibacteriota bacterium]
RAILEGVFYGAFPFIFILMLTPLMGKVFQGYLTVLFSLQLWFPLEAIVNLFTSLKMKEMLVAAGQSNAYGALAVDTLSGFPYMYQLTQEMLAAAWAFELIIPVLAYSLVRGGEYALTHAIGSFTSMSQRAGSAPAHAAATGNIGLGNVGMGSVNWDNVSAHGHDISYRTNLGAAMNVSSGGTWGPHGFSFRRATVDGFSQSMGHVVSAGLREAATTSMEAGNTHLAQASKSADATFQKTRSFANALEHSHGHTRSSQAAEELGYVKDAQEARQALIQKGIDLGFSREAMTQYANAYGVGGAVGGGLGKEGKGFGAFLKGDLSRNHQEIGKVNDRFQELERWSQDNRISERISRGQRVVDSYAADTRDNELSRTAREIRAGQTETVGHVEQASTHFREAENYSKTADKAAKMDYSTAAQIEHMYLKTVDPETKAAYAKGDDLALVAGGAAWAKEHAPELQKALGDAAGFEAPIIEKPVDNTATGAIPTVDGAAKANVGRIPSAPAGYGSAKDDVHSGEQYIRASLQGNEQAMRETEDNLDTAKGRMENVGSGIMKDANEPGIWSVTRGTNKQTVEEAEEKRKR